MHSRLTQTFTTLHTCSAYTQQQKDLKLNRSKVRVAPFLPLQRKKQKHIHKSSHKHTKNTTWAGCSHSPGKPWYHTCINNCTIHVHSTCTCTCTVLFRYHNLLFSFPKFSLNNCLHDFNFVRPIWKFCACGNSKPACMLRCSSCISVCCTVICTQTNTRLCETSCQS